MSLILIFFMMIGGVSSQVFLKAQSGTFIIFKKGRPVGEENFFLGPYDSGFLLKSSVEMKEEENRIDLRGELKTDSSMQPLSYKLVGHTPSGTQKISLRRKGKGFYLGLRQPGYEEEKNIFFKERALLIDNYFMSHYIFLLERFYDLETTKKAEKIKVITPQSMTYFHFIPGKIDDVEIKGGGEKSLRAKRFRFKLDEYRVELLEKHGKLLGGVFPEDSVSFSRKGLFPEGFEIKPLPH